jgi:hypothetical protein
VQLHALSALYNSSEVSAVEIVPGIVLSSSGIRNYSSRRNYAIVPPKGLLMGLKGGYDNQHSRTGVSGYDSSATTAGTAAGIPGLLCLSCLVRAPLLHVAFASVSG